MNRVWLRRAGESRLLIFFNGWSCDAGCLRHLQSGAFDVLAVYDYTEPGELASAVAGYESVALAAWSLGVWAAAECFENTGIKFTSALAINGTLFPVDDARGIPVAVFDGTLDHWDDGRVRKKFAFRMGGGAGSPLSPESARPPEEQRNELAALRRRILARSAPPRNLFDRAVIGARDRIFPPGAQRAAWAYSGTEVVELPLPHDPLPRLSTWEEVIDLGRN